MISPCAGFLERSRRPMPADWADDELVAVILDSASWAGEGPPLRRVVFHLASVVAVIGGAAALPSGASAHHTIEAIYDLSLQIETTATFEKVDWINPHVWMRFDIQYSNGRIEKNAL